MSADQTSGWAQVAAAGAVPNAFRGRSLNGSVTPMVGAGRDHPVMVLPVRVAPGMPGRALVAPGTADPALVAPGTAVVRVAPGMGPPGMGPLEMPAVSRFAVKQAEPGMRFVQAVGANVPTGNVPPAVLLMMIGSTELAAAQIGPSSVIGHDLSVVLPTLALRSAAPLSAVPLSGDPSIAVLAAVPLVDPQPVLRVALGPRVLGLAGRMGPGPTVAILMPPVLTAAEIAQAPGP